MAKVQVLQLIGPALDWAVAQCTKAEVSLDIERNGSVTLWVPMDWPIGERELYSPSSSWAQSGPIIDHEGIGIRRDTAWHAQAPGGVEVTAADPLTAAMRCFVLSTLGAEIDLPEPLVA